MPVLFEPDLLDDEDVQAVLTAIDSRLCNMADFVKGEAINFGNLDKQKRLVKEAQMMLGVDKLRFDWREVVADAATAAGCLNFLMGLKPLYLEQTIVATRFPVEVAVVILQAALTVRGTNE